MTGILFAIGFVVVLVAFGFLIAFVSKRLTGNIEHRLYGIIETILIAGILVGAVGLFQPVAIQGYEIGFHVLLVATLGFTVWSHVTPKRVKA